MTELCPACGLDQLELVTETRRYAPPYGEAVEYQIPMRSCRACGESFEAENTAKLVKQAIEDADRMSVKAMVEHLETKKFTMAYMERVLSLAPRTIARWKMGEVSAAALALLRIVRTYPWILRVAKARFDPDTAKHALMFEVSRANAATFEAIGEAANNNNQSSRANSDRVDLAA